MQAVFVQFFSVLFPEFGQWHSPLCTYVGNDKIIVTGI